MGVAKLTKGEEYSAEEARERFDKLLRTAVNMKPQPAIPSANYRVRTSKGRL